MITFITHIGVRTENSVAFEALLTDVRDKVREIEPDVLYYDFARSAKDPGTYVVIEVYRDEAAHAAHMESDWVKASIPKSVSLVENGKFDVKQYVSPGTAPVPRRFDPDGSPPSP